MEYPAVRGETGAEIGQQLGNRAGGSPARVTKIGFLVRLEAIRVYLAEERHALAYAFAANQAVGSDLSAGAQDPRRSIEITTPAKVGCAQSTGFGPLRH